MTKTKKMPEHAEGMSGIELADIINVPAIQSLLDDFYKIARISASIVDLNGNVLVGTGWQKVCTEFHRSHPETRKHCIESDIQLSKGVREGEFRLYRCKNNIWDVATPIMVGGRHVGNLFSGQFFFDDETPDYNIFRSQAARYGFDERAYISAVDEVPRLSRESVNTGMAFLAKLAQLISSLSYSNIELARSLQKRKETEDRLRQSIVKKRMLADILEKSDQPLGIGYPDGRLGLVNRAFCELTGYSPEELEEIPWNSALTPPEWIDQEMAALEKIGRTGKPVRYQKEYMRKDGCRVPVELLVHIMRDKSGEVSHYYAFVTDITERRRTEERLRQLADRLFLAARAANVGIWDLDIQADKLIWDDAMHRLYRIAPEQFTGKTDAWKSGVHPEDLDRALREVEMALRGEKEFDTEFRVLWPDQSVHYIKAIGLVQRDPLGKPVRMLGTNWDVTERRHAEDALRASEQRYHSLFDNMMEGFAYCRMLYEDGNPSDFEYLEVNIAFERLTGLKDVVGRKVTSVIPGIRESNPELFDIYGRVAGTGHAEKFEMYVEPLAIWFSISVYSQEKGYFVAVFENITDRKRSEEALRRSFDEIEDLYNNAPCGYHSIDKEGVFVRMNNTELGWLGYTRGEVIGKMNMRDILSEEGKRKFEDSFRLLMERGRVKDMEREFIR
ncbi:MAG TPA: PocR ligand-binding domain-containing protein, partial [Thermodesulfovibrionales bacterium]|nr:PocR ligand-binding domain-containing protein [Thermodesulfovibrionales bacterium]